MDAAKAENTLCTSLTCPVHTTFAANWAGRAVMVGASQLLATILHIWSTDISLRTSFWISWTGLTAGYLLDDRTCPSQPPTAALQQKAHEH